MSMLSRALKDPLVQRGKVARTGLPACDGRRVHARLLDLIVQKVITDGNPAVPGCRHEKSHAAGSSDD